MDHKFSTMKTALNFPWMQPWMRPETDRLEALAEGYIPISLEQMEAFALLNRTDTKFLLTTRQLQAALAAVQDGYWMLAVDGQRLNHYRTLYFDTPDFALYLLHVNERADRYKVRSREYTDSRQKFLEVKHKTNKGRTIKERIPTPQPVMQMTPEAEGWLQTVFPYEYQALEPKLWNTFTRLTLVNKQCCERVTLDVDLTFYNERKSVQLGELAIAEMKMDRENRTSAFWAQMRAQKIQPRSFSKYCMGVSMIFGQVKKNALKPNLLWISKMNQGAVCYE